MNTHRGEVTLSTFAIRTAKDTNVGSVIMEIQAWERTAGQTDHEKKGRAVAMDGQLTQHEFLGPDGRLQTRTAIRADRLQLVLPPTVPGRREAKWNWFTFTLRVGTADTGR